MRSSTLWIIVGIIIIAVGGWYLFDGQRASDATPSQTAGINGGADQGNTGSTDENGQVQQPGDGSDISENLTLGVDSSAELGDYLVAYNGMTLYTFTKDSVGTTTCYGQCATNWPPYTVPAGMQLNLQSLVGGDAGTIVRADGTTQVTYQGMPLYFWKNDAKPGDTTGQGVGEAWYVVTP